MFPATSIHFLFFFPFFLRGGIRSGGGAWGLVHVDFGGARVAVALGVEGFEGGDAGEDGPGWGERLLVSWRVFFFFDVI